MTALCIRNEILDQNLTHGKSEANILASGMNNLKDASQNTLTGLCFITEKEPIFEVNFGK